MNYQRAVNKKRTNLSIKVSLLSEAKELGINVSASAENGLKMAITDEKKKRWLRENQSAIQSSNLFVEENGLPLAKYRTF